MTTAVPAEEAAACRPSDDSLPAGRCQRAHVLVDESDSGFNCQPEKIHMMFLKQPAEEKHQIKPRGRMQRGQQVH